MRITVCIDSNETIEIRYSDLKRMIGSLEADDRNMPLFAALASHPASYIRSLVAAKRCLPVDLLGNMARDKSAEVVRCVALNSHAVKKFDVSLVQEMINRDVGVANTIAGCIFRGCKSGLHERKDIIQLLLMHADPGVIEMAKNAQSVLEAKTERRISNAESNLS